MKRLTIGLILISGVLIGIPPSAVAETFKIPCSPNGDTYTVESGIAKNGNYCEGSLSIDKSVKLIENYAFSRAPLTSVIIPNSVILIGEYAFENSSLTSVSIPNSVTSIGRNAFGHTNLTSITIPNSVKDIGVLAFEYSGLTSAIIGDSVTVIGDSAFKDSSLNSVKIGDSVVSIGNSAFRGTKLTSVSIPNSVKFIGQDAFAATPLTSVNFGNSLTGMLNGAFQYTKLTNVTIPDSLTYISNGAFSDSDLKTVNLGNSITSIGAFAFKNTQLTSISLPNSVKEILSYAFDGNLSLSKISLPDGIQAINMNAFNRNISLTSIEYCGTLTGFPIVPICPPDRLAVIEKAAAEKAAAEKAAAEKAAAEKAAADLILKVEVDVWCENTYIGNPINCNSSFSIKGRDFSKAIKSGLFEVFTRVEGQKNWNFNTKFKVTVKPYSTSSYSFIPDELRVETKFNLKNLKMGAKPLLVMYKFTTDTKYSGTDRILPQTSVKIIAPGSVYVGETFNVKILTSKLFNGKCSIGNANTSISNGVGYLKLRTTNIGSITLRAYCESKNWILTGATWKMYSRE